MEKSIKYHGYILSTILIIFMVTNLFAQKKSNSQIDSKFELLRKKMVEKQIQRRGIKDVKIIEAFLKVERHKFVPEGNKTSAYDDRPLPIGSGQTISQPYIVAFMTEALNLQGDEKILEIGTGSGYQAAILAELSDSIFTIEIFEALGSTAKKLFNQLGHTNIHSKIGDGYKGWKENAPFDRIIVTCAPSEIPEALIEQLSEGGIMIIPVGKQLTQKLVLLKKENGIVKQKDVLPVRFVPMIDKSGRKY